MLNYRNVSAATLLLGIVLMLIGFVMGGFTSVNWAGFIGAGIALTIHGSLATIGSFVMSSSNAQAEKEDTR
ncbi:MAG: hypothetical protein R3C20_25310 [Planctomycetaceae bacterium]